MSNKEMKAIFDKVYPAKDIAHEQFYYMFNRNNIPKGCILDIPVPSSPWAIDNVVFQLHYVLSEEFPDQILLTRFGKDVGKIWHEYDNFIHLFSIESGLTYKFPLKSKLSVSTEECINAMMWFFCPNEIMSIKE